MKPCLDTIEKETLQRLEAIKMVFVPQQDEQLKRQRRKKRGLSRDQVAVGTALDRLGNLKMGLICTGRLQYPALRRFYEGHISANSILCTDSADGYATVSEELNLNHVNIESGRRKKDIYHMQHINSLHSRLKSFMTHF